MYYRTAVNYKMRLVAFNKMCFLDVLIMVLLALTLSEYISFCSHHICINNGRHNHACLTG